MEPLVSYQPDTEIYLRNWTFVNVTLVNETSQDGYYQLDAPIEWGEEPFTVLIDYENSNLAYNAEYSLQQFKLDNNISDFPSLE